MPKNKKGFEMWINQGIERASERSERALPNKISTGGPFSSCYNTSTGIHNVGRGFLDYSHCLFLFVDF